MCVREHTHVCASQHACVCREHTCVCGRERTSMCATQTQWKFTLKTRWGRCFEVALAYFFRSAPSPISRGRLCSKGQGSKGQGKALLQGFNNARARSGARIG